MKSGDGPQGTKILGPEHMSPRKLRPPCRPATLLQLNLESFHCLFCVVTILVLATTRNVQSH